MLYLCYMDTTIRNLDEVAYRAIKGRAAVLGKTVGELISEAIRAYLSENIDWGPPGSLKEIRPESYGPGSERLSEQIDSLVYGSRGP